MMLGGFNSCSEVHHGRRTPIGCFEKMITTRRLTAVTGRDSEAETDDDAKFDG